MQKRRDFIRQGSLFLLGGWAIKNSQIGISGSYNFPPPGVQLFTFFNVIEKDVPGTLKKIADLGYREIESAFSMKGGYYGLTATEFSKLLGDLGLTWKSHHVGGVPFGRPSSTPPKDGQAKPGNAPVMKNLRDNYQEIVDEMAAAGVEYLVCAGIPVQTKEDIKASLETLQKSGEAAKKAGVKLAYHNHEAEFKEVEGIKPYDLFLKETGKDIMNFELDLCWATKAGADPVELFRRHPGRFPLWHVKDITADNKLVPVGQGIINFRNIFDNADKAGLKYYFVEHDMPSDPFASISASIKTLKSLTGV